MQTITNELVVPPALMSDIREETDIVALRYPGVPLDELADALERSLMADDGSIMLVLGVIFELRRRASTGVRTWATPTLVTATEVA